MIGRELKDYVRINGRDDKDGDNDANNYGDDIYGGGSDGSVFICVQESKRKVGFFSTISKQYQNNCVYFKYRNGRQKCKWT